MDREIQVYVIYTTVFFNKELSTTDQGLPSTAVQQCINEQVCSFMRKFHIQLDIPFMGNIKRILHYTK